MEAAHDGVVVVGDDRRRDLKLKVGFVGIVSMSRGVDESLHDDISIVFMYDGHFQTSQAINA